MLITVAFVAAPTRDATGNESPDPISATTRTTVTVGSMPQGGWSDTPTVAINRSTGEIAVHWAHRVEGTNDSWARRFDSGLNPLGDAVYLDPLVQNADGDDYGSFLAPNMAGDGWLLEYWDFHDTSGFVPSTRSLNREMTVLGPERSGTFLDFLHQDHAHQRFLSLIALPLGSAGEIRAGVSVRDAALDFVGGSEQTQVLGVTEQSMSSTPSVASEPSTGKVAGVVRIDVGDFQNPVESTWLQVWDAQLDLTTDLRLPDGIAGAVHATFDIGFSGPDTLVLVTHSGPQWEPTAQVTWLDIGVDGLAPAVATVPFAAKIENSVIFGDIAIVSWIDGLDHVITAITRQGDLVELDRAFSPNPTIETTLDVLGNSLVTTRSLSDFDEVSIEARLIDLQTPPSAVSVSAAAVRNQFGASAALAIPVGDGDATDIRVEWPAPADGGSPITGYDVTIDGVFNQTLSADVRAVRIVGAQPGQAVSVEIAARTAAGVGPAGSATTTAIARDGYWMLESDGTVYPFGYIDHHGDSPVDEGVTALQLVPTPDNGGYLILRSDGTVTAHGNATHHGDGQTISAVLADGERYATMSATPDGTGYWIFTDRGRVLAFGAAQFLGDVTHLTLAGPVIASVATPTGLGYYMVGSDGGIFTFGDAVFRGSVPQVVSGPLNQPVVGISPTPDNQGYWLVAADGGIFSFNAPFRGSIPQVVSGPLNQPVNGMVAYGSGYLLVAADGGVFSFSERQFLGSLGANPPDTPITAINPMR